eukprot:2232084-Pyramimonas_sp.AAC.1
MSRASAPLATQIALFLERGRRPWGFDGSPRRLRSLGPSLALLGYVMQCHPARGGGDKWLQKAGPRHGG